MEKENAGLQEKTASKAFSISSTPSKQPSTKSLAFETVTEPLVSSRPHFQSHAPRKPAVETTSHSAGSEQKQLNKEQVMRHLRQLPFTSASVIGTQKPQAESQ